MQKAKNKIHPNFFKILGFFILLFVHQNSFAANSRNLTIFAEQNMSLALTKIARIYSQKTNTIVSLNFNSSIDLINEIDSGEPADVFISAHHGWIESLHQKGLVDVYNVGYIARDELILITSKSNPNLPSELISKKLSLEESLRILDKNKTDLIIDAEGNSSGYFSNHLIKNMVFSNIKIFNKLAEDKTPLFDIIKNNEENYSLLLSSQVRKNTNFQIIARKKDETIFYQALVIAGDNMEIAREFLKFLKSPTAQTILRESGFIVD